MAGCQAIALELHISDGAFRTRLSGIYRKFSISGNGPVKSNRLFRLLTQEYQKVSPLSSQSFNTSVANLDVLVQKVRQQRHEKIQDQCGTMRMLDIAKSIKLTDIYTDVNILENIPSQQWREIPDLPSNFGEGIEQEFR
ncbi:hypothetical protein [Dendronalium sp. ChiSLP03b]|uniref:hypothetical protein n=1 Tax=Dendronalium sp. ChiSLP03b TaxID=3075381 RepID=UPI002AD2B382|nr:hypothetical protein [Dendronalium sp. ChiSLP03b]MDZ8208071.1 hypothetical protein [Dendronalium sp. ChiSLP03b]